MPNQTGPTRSPLLDGLSPYRGQPRPDGIELDLSRNEGARPSSGWWNPLPLDPELLRRYPDGSRLEAALASEIGIGRDRVLLTAGADDALERVMRAVLAPDREVVLPNPTFEMLPRYATLTGARRRDVDWIESGFPLEPYLAAGRTASLVVVVSPNSPTGLLAPTADLIRLARSLPRSLLLVDLAYVEFAPEDPTAELLGEQNVVVTRTLSKAWGLAGLRVGWAAGPAPVVDWLRTAGHPFAVSSLSLAVAERALESGLDDVRSYAERVCGEREELNELLLSLGAMTWPSAANFVLARVDDGEKTHRDLAGRGILVRRFPGERLLVDTLRITLPGDADGFERLKVALKEVLR